jgi:hypothetical protein
MKHHPHARFKEWRWGKVTVQGPKLKVADAKTQLESAQSGNRAAPEEHGHDFKVVNVKAGSAV